MLLSTQLDNCFKYIDKYAVESVLRNITTQFLLFLNFALRNQLKKQTFKPCYIVIPQNINSPEGVAVNKLTEA